MEIKLTISDKLAARLAGMDMQAMVEAFLTVEAYNAEARQIDAKATQDKEALRAAVELDRAEKVVEVRASGKPK